MSFDFSQVGKRLRAYRMGAGLSTDEVADRLGISRAALYRYEKGEVIKIETLDRVADLLDISLPSLLGVGSEYFSNSVSYFERLRQLEEQSDRVVAYYDHIAFRLTSARYPTYLRKMLTEGLPQDVEKPSHANQQVEQVVDLLEMRRREAIGRRQSIVCLIGSTQLQRYLRAGLIGTFSLSLAEREERRRWARDEVLGLADQMDSEPIGVQIGVVQDNLPAQAFQVLHTSNGAYVTVSPFRLGELPNVRLGVASITSSPEAVELYEAVASELWMRALKGQRGARLLRALVSESEIGTYAPSGID